MDSRMDANVRKLVAVAKGAKKDLAAWVRGWGDEAGRQSRADTQLVLDNLDAAIEAVEHPTRPCTCCNGTGQRPKSKEQGGE